MFAIMQFIKIAEIYARLDDNWLIYFTGISIDFITLVLHIWLASTDPGYIRKDDLTFIKLLETINPEILCPDCQVIRPPRSRHCILCGQCVDRYDHHCPWINNCVGIKNHNLFMFYLIFQLISLLVTIIFSVLATI